MKKIIPVILSLICIIVMFSGCSTVNNDNAGLTELTVSDLGVIHETEFGGVYVDITIDDFNALGFGFGDSVNVTFSNGYKLDDLPYYNGYYVKTGEPLIIGYPGYPHIKVCINNGDDLWELAGVDEIRLSKCL